MVWCEYTVGNFQQKSDIKIDGDEFGNVNTTCMFLSSKENLKPISSDF